MNINDIKINNFQKELVENLFGSSLMISPMKVWSLPKNKAHMREQMLNDPNYFKLVKKDGYWYQFEKNSEGNCYLFSKTVSKKTGLYPDKGDNIPHIMTVLNEKLPKGTILIGETYLPNKRSSDVTKIMGCLPTKAVERQKEKEDRIRYYVHDVLMYNGTLLVNVNNYVRYQLLRKIFNDCQIIDDYIELAQEIITDDGMSVLQDLLNNGEEGLVMKKKEGIYHPDARPAWEMIKFKRTTGDLDVICLGFEPPNKEYEGSEIETWKYWADELNHIYAEKVNGSVPVTKSFAKGWIGALKVGVYDGDKIIQLGTVSSGLTETLLMMIKENPELFINHPLTIGAMEINTIDKTLRHAYINSKVGYNGFRDDIEITDCTWDKMLVADIKGGDDD